MNFFKKKKKSEPKDEMEIVLSEDTEIRFRDYPEDNTHISPFEPIDGGNYFWIMGGELFTYLGDFEDFGHLSSFDFNGRTNLYVYKRLAIVENGELIYYNKNFDDGHVYGDKYGYRENIEEDDIVEEEPITHTTVLKLYDDDGNVIESSRKKVVKFEIILERKLLRDYAYFSMIIKEKRHQFIDLNSKKYSIQTFDDEESVMEFATKLSARYGIKCIVAQTFKYIWIY